MAEGEGKTTRNIAKKTHDMLMQMAHTDQLTELLNRRGTINTAESIQKTLYREGMNPTVSVAMLDMIGLKALNKELREVGADKIIASAANSMRRMIRASDTAGRWGGDEFMIVSFDTDSSGMDSLINKVLEYRPDKINYNVAYKVFEPGTDVLDAIEHVFGSLEDIKKGLPMDETGRSTGKGTVVELD